MPSQTGYPLRGKQFLVTRPEGQGVGLVEGIRALGGDATHIPFLAIEPVADQSALVEITSHLSDYLACIFISANAVRMAWPQLARQGWPQMVTAAAVGPGTGRVLKAQGISRIVVPHRQFDSEGLLAEPFFAECACHGQAIALIRGEGGRDFLAQSLRARGAHVDEAVVYQRCLHPDALTRLQRWLPSESASLASLMMLISSSESLQRVMASTSPMLAARLRDVPLLVPHAKIAECARKLGFAKIDVSDGGDDGLLNFLQSYN